MKQFKRLIICLVFLLFQIYSLVYSCEIISPTASLPTIIKKGGNLNIIFAEKPSATSFKATLLTSYFEIPLLINSTKFEGDLYQINATIPKDAPIELYSLKVTSSECSDIKERSVKVIEEYKDNFSFIHITDTHIGHENGKAEERLEKVIEEVNLLNPEFVLITGDIVHSCENVGRALMLRQGKPVPTTDFEKYLGPNWKEMTDEEIKKICIKQYNTFLELLSKFRVPTYIIPGNHDMAGLYNPPCKEFYEQMIGKRYYSFDYGDYHFTGCDNSHMMEASPMLYPGFKDDLEEEQLNWLEEDLKNNQDKKLKVAFFHCPIYKKTCKFKELLEKYKVDIALAGHWHFDLIEKKDKPIWILTTSTAAPVSVLGEQHAGYRIIKIEEGKIASYSYYGKYSIPYNKLNYKFTPANDGKNYEVTCNIKNELEQGFDNALIRFIMPKDAKYEIIGGELIQEVLTPNLKLLYVKVNIPEEEEIEVRVKSIKDVKK